MPTLGRRRALGQHFLKDRALCEQIADRALELSGEEGCRGILEIGPGRGALTYPLIERLSAKPGTPLVLVERDPKLAEFWREELMRLDLRSTRAEAICDDFTSAPEPSWLKHPPIAVVSNLPYSAGTAILTRLAKKRAEIPFMLLMFQAEVAARLRAKVSTKAWGSLSVWIQNHWDVERFASVPPGAFQPPPEVHSEVVLLRRRTVPRIPSSAVDSSAEELWQKLLTVSFAQRRKMLRSGLPPSGPWRNALVESGVDGTRRAESLDWPEWTRFFEALLRVRAS